MLLHISLLFLKVKKTMKKLEWTEYDMEWKVRIYKQKWNWH